MADGEGLVEYSGRFRPSYILSKLQSEREAKRLALEKKRLEMRRALKKQEKSEKIVRLKYDVGSGELKSDVGSGELKSDVESEEACERTGRSDTTSVLCKGKLDWQMLTALYPEQLHAPVPQVNLSKKDSWEERVVKVLHFVRLHQITEDDPAQQFPVQTRFCRYNLAYFDFEKESKAVPGPPFLELNSYEHKLLESSVNIVSLTIHESAMDYPIKVFGTVIARDQVDYKCVYLFRCDTDDPQVINSPKDLLTLTDPCRGLAVTCSMFFEINLKMECDSGEIVLSKGVIEHNACASDGKLETKFLTSWHSTVRLEYTPVPFAVIATLSVCVLNGACDFIGKVVAWTSLNKNEIILHDSKVAGTSTELGEGGSVSLSRRLVAVPVDEELVVRICVGDDDGCKVACFEGTLGHLDDCRTFCQGLYMLKVKAEWVGNTRRENVYEYVGCNKLLV